MNWKKYFRPPGVLLRPYLFLSPWSNTFISNCFLFHTWGWTIFVGLWVAITRPIRNNRWRRAGRLSRMVIICDGSWTSAEVSCLFTIDESWTEIMVWISIVLLVIVWIIVNRFYGRVLYSFGLWFDAFFGLLYVIFTLGSSAPRPARGGGWRVVVITQALIICL